MKNRLHVVLDTYILLSYLLDGNKHTANFLSQINKAAKQATISYCRFKRKLTKVNYYILFIFSNKAFVSEESLPNFLAACMAVSAAAFAFVLSFSL